MPFSDEIEEGAQRAWGKTCRAPAFETWMDDPSSDYIIAAQTT